MSEGVCDMSGIVPVPSGGWAQPTMGRRAPRGLPGAAVRAGRLLELWGYRAARPREPRASVEEPYRTMQADRVGGASSLMVSRPRIY
jgi:hypothetical protein